MASHLFCQHILERNVFGASVLSEQAHMWLEGNCRGIWANLSQLGGLSEADPLLCQTPAKGIPSTGFIYPFSCRQNPKASENLPKIFLLARIGTPGQRKPEGQPKYSRSADFRNVVKKNEQYMKSTCNGVSLSLFPLLFK